MVYLGLGSNLGDRMQHILDAIRLIVEHPNIEVLNVSSVYETKPYGRTDQPAFLNIVMKIDTTMSPYELLDFVKGIEVKLGRTDTGRWGPRTIDIDILFFKDIVLEEQNLKIPHYDFENRPFFVYPLMEIEPDFVHPTKRKKLQDIAKEKNLSIDEIKFYKKI